MLRQRPKNNLVPSSNLCLASPSIELLTCSQNISQYLVCGKINTKPKGFLMTSTVAVLRIGLVPGSESELLEKTQFQVFTLVLVSCCSQQSDRVFHSYRVF